MHGKEEEMKEDTDCTVRNIRLHAIWEETSGRVNK